MIGLDDTRTRLLEAAEQVFAEKGFKAASVREICKLARANLAAVNYHFGDKERLYIEAVKYAYRGCTEGAPLPDWPVGTPPMQKLREFIRVMVLRMTQPQKPASTQLMMRELANPTAACVEWVREYIQPVAQTLEVILGELMPADTTRVQRFLHGFSIVGQCLFYRQNRPVAALLLGDEAFGQLDAELLTEHITRFTLSGLGLAPAGEEGSPATVGSREGALP